MTQIRVKRYVRCPLSATLEFAEQAVSRRSGLYVTPAPPLGERVRVAAATTEDTTDSARKHDALLLAWRPQTPGMFPDFQGVLTVRPHNGGASLRLNGRYEPPFGALGKIFDTIAGRSIAAYTMRNFLGDLANEIEAAYRQECAAHA